jgi:hypothetical protein
MAQEGKTRRQIKGINASIVSAAGKLKNPCKATRFYFDTHDCVFDLEFIIENGWLAR